MKIDPKFVELTAGISLELFYKLLIYMVWLYMV